MARAIVRYSIDGEPSNQTGNACRALLETAGFDKVGTASFDALDIPMTHALSAIEHLVNLLHNPKAGGRVDHLWIYLDEPGPDGEPG